MLKRRHAADQLDHPPGAVHGDPVGQRHRLGRADAGQHPGQAEQDGDDRDTRGKLARVAVERAVGEQPVAEGIAGGRDRTEDEQGGDQGHPAGGGTEAVEEQDRRQPGQPPR